jgi:hypothetical protein
MQLELFSPNREPLAPPVSPKLAEAREEGERLRREGMRRAAINGAGLLGYARELAFDLARANGGECHADMVAAALKAEGYQSLGNAAGSLFAPSMWEDTGKIFKSERPESHRNKLVVWRLKHPTPKETH